MKSPPDDGPVAGAETGGADASLVAVATDCVYTTLVETENE